MSREFHRMGMAKPWIGSMDDMMHRQLQAPACQSHSSSSFLGVSLFDTSTGMLLLLLISSWQAMTTRVAGHETLRLPTTKNFNKNISCRCILQIRGKNEYYSFSIFLNYLALLLQNMKRLCSRGKKQTRCNLV